jgi:hypothetical protein
MCDLLWFNFVVIVGDGKFSSTVCFDRDLFWVLVAGNAGGVGTGDGFGISGGVGIGPPKIEVGGGARGVRFDG